MKQKDKVFYVGKDKEGKWTKQKRAVSENSFKCPRKLE